MGVPSEWLDQACRDRGVALMGVLNVTPDSFFDGGRYVEAEAARQRVDRLLAEGAAIIDIGAESSRPGATPVPPDRQLERVEPALKYAVSRGAMVSIDTTSPEVADEALRLGARFVNDVSCLSDAALAATAARHGATLVLMHSRGALGAMKSYSDYPDGGYADVVDDVRAEWRAARDRAAAEGLAPRDVWLDPGIGFAKNARQSFELLGRLEELTGEGVPVVVGPSRKSFISAVDGAVADERLGGTIAACLLAAERGARVLRVHDVKAVGQALGVVRRARDAAARESP
ncbi:MAG TPA: dihydropteroate synthase [Polyangiaceae bacterium]